ncbi:MAG: hypothetical protein LBQ39_08565 [Tannerellaceae bacterium]|nr:hypothetical protein [Tannerellaceae bacterium]
MKKRLILFAVLALCGCTTTRETVYLIPSESAYRRPKPEKVYPRPTQKNRFTESFHEADSVFNSRMK